MNESLANPKSICFISINIPVVTADGFITVSYVRNILMT